MDKVARIVIVELDDAEGVESRKGKAKKKTVLVLTEKDDDKVRRHSDRKNQQPAARLLQIPSYSRRGDQEFVEYERQLKIEATTRHATSRVGRDLPPFSIGDLYCRTEKGHVLEADISFYDPAEAHSTS